MNSFLPTEQRIDHTRERYPPFPREPAVLVRLIKHLHKLVHDDANATLRPYGLNHPEYNLLMMLYGTPGGALSASELAESSGEKSANITRLTNGLCDKGLIARTADEDDRRKVMLALTPAGEALIGALLPDVCALLDRQMRTLDAGDQRQLEGLLKKMLSGLTA
ncbi:MAG TPA: MarR family transcriptional regulator [Luteibacter sp.]|jgi:MarR family transcriptional repressor of emrRAB|nr:MarR family transcriptional regulator [Luteibacter sp.]